LSRSTQNTLICHKTVKNVKHSYLLIQSNHFYLKTWCYTAAGDVNLNNWLILINFSQFWWKLINFHTGTLFFSYLNLNIYGKIINILKLIIYGHLHRSETIIGIVKCIYCSQPLIIWLKLAFLYFQLPCTK